MENKKVNYNISKKNGLSIDELNILLKKWQTKLNMNDWNLDVKIVDFLRKDFRQSGDFIADTKKKTASILLTWDPWRGNEEYTLLHELIHVFVYDFDSFAEKNILEHHQTYDEVHDLYMDKLEELVHALTKVLLGKGENLPKKEG